MKKRKKLNYLDTKQQFNEAIKYIRESSLFIYSTVSLFIFSTFIGFFYHENFTFLDEVIKEIILKTQGLNTQEMVFFILQNNLQSALYSISLGTFLGIFPLFSTLSNGVVIGYVSQQVVSVAGISEMWRLLPHGIFELPAIFISFGLGIKLGFSIFSKQKIKEFKRRFYNSANVFLMIIIPLLIIAAIIEGLLIVLTG